MSKLVSRLAGLGLCGTVLCCALVAPVSSGAGEASGFDPASIDQCLEGSSDCASAGMTECLEYTTQHYKGDEPDFPQKNCLDAAHQAWEAKLTDVYEALLAAEAKHGIKPSEMLRQAEHGWIKFRDNLCTYETESALARNESGEIAKLTCLRDEAARHWLLLNARLTQ